MTDKSRKYSTILFDFDGTLTPSLELWVEGLRHAFAKFDKFPSDDEIINRVLYRDYEEVVADFKLSSTEEFSQHVEVGLSESFARATLFEGVVEVLEECSNLKIKMGVVTSSPRVIVNRTLRKWKVHSFFKSIVTADDITHFKPHPEPVLLAMKRLKGLAPECLFIGDSMHDILAGQAAGIETALFFPDNHSQFYDYNALVDAGPDFIFRSYKDVLSLFQTA
jgi:pyrophosphatase PpaX